MPLNVNIPFSMVYTYSCLLNNRGLSCRGSLICRYFSRTNTILHDLLVVDWISEHRALIWRSDYNVICRVSTVEGLPFLTLYGSRVSCKNKTLAYTPTYIQSLEIHMSPIIHIYLYHDIYISNFAILRLISSLWYHYVTSNIKW